MLEFEDEKRNKIEVEKNVQTLALFSNIKSDYK